jgi:hypothetical protein
MFKRQALIRQMQANFFEFLHIDQSLRITINNLV